MFCQQCGKEIENEDLPYCPNCGAKIRGDSQEEANERKKREEANEYALSSMLTGIMSLLLPILDLPLSIVALVLASKNPENPYAKVGKMTGTIGLILSIVIYVALMIWGIVYLLAVISKMPGYYPSSSLQCLGFIPN